VAITRKIAGLPLTGSVDAALALLPRASEIRLTDQGYRFLALVWQGQWLDLLDRRAEAIAAYRAARATGSTFAFRHDQYHLVIDQKWVEQRLVSRFERQ